MPATTYLIRRKVLTLFGAQFHVYNADGKVIGFSKQKAFKLKEDIRIFSDETAQDERVSIQARQIIDFGAAYDVIDSKKQTKVGALKRKGWTSILRDSWIVMDENDVEIGKVEEDSMLMAMLRRFLGAWIPQRFHLSDGHGEQFASFQTHFNPFVHKMTVTVEEGCPVSPLLVLATGILLVAIEGRQG
ncbi:MAG: hypothetical protein ACKV0T_10645 [Planctomycetales bacterium]